MSTPNNDGYSCEYERQRAERIKQNKEYLLSLGLGDFHMTKKKKKRVTTNSSTMAKKKNLSPRVVTPAGKERRSSRLSTSNKETRREKLVMLTYDDNATTPVVVVSSTRKRRRSEYRTPDLSPDLSNSRRRVSPVDPSPSRRRILSSEDEEFGSFNEEDKKVLNVIDDNFLAKFEEFLVVHDKISHQNVRNVMRQIGKLVRGEGIRYESPRYGWPENCYFQKSVKICPLTNVVKLISEGRECEDRWGRDHGNGWLINHPLKKLLRFQQFALTNPDFLTSKCRLVDYCEFR